MIAFQSRKYGEKQTTSQFIACDGDKIAFHCKVLEPQWNNNERNNSCINEGDYWVLKHKSPKYGWCFMIVGVIDRDYILFHWGNYRENTEGCSIVGYEFKDINSDGLKDVTSSKRTFNAFMKVMPDRWLLCIRSDT